VIVNDQREQKHDPIEAKRVGLDSPMETHPFPELNSGLCRPKSGDLAFVIIGPKSCVGSIRTAGVTHKGFAGGG
jgi:hypothetical protein